MYTKFTAYLRCQIPHSNSLNGMIYRKWLIGVKKTLRTLVRLAITLTTTKETLPSGEVELQENLEVSFSTRNTPSNCITGLLLETKDL